MLRLGEVALRRKGSLSLLVALVAALAVPACTTDHDALARRPSEGGSGGVGGSGGFGNGGFGNTGNTAQGGRPNPDDEPPGDDVLTIVNGVVDAPSVRLCFARLADDGSAELVGSPLPELAYAASAVLTELEDLSFDDALEPWVIAGELARIDDLSCAEAVELAQELEAEVTPQPEPEPEPEPNGGASGAGGAGGAENEPETGAGGQGGAAPELERPALRARSLGVLPGGTFNIGRSILMAMSGCLGGAAYGGVPLSAVCGEGYAPDAPTLQPVVVKLSREVGFDKVGLQGVHASLAMGPLDLRVTGDSGRTTLVFASSITFGEVAPRPADTRFSPTELGVDARAFGLQAVGEAAEVLHEAAWSTVLQSSGVSEISAGRSYTAVLLGPRPRLFQTGFWNQPAFALVENDPTRQ